MDSSLAQSAGAAGQRPTAIALIDGEHYPPVVIDALRELGARYAFVAAVFLGGGEKLREPQPLVLDELYGLPVTVARRPPRGPARRPFRGAGRDRRAGGR